MAKQKKTNQILVPPVPLEAIADVRGEKNLIELPPELEWQGLAPALGE